MIVTRATSQSWSNVTRAIQNFKTDDKTLIKILKFIPNVMKLIASFCVDISNKVLMFFGKKPFEIGAQKDIKDNSKPGTIRKVINFMSNHKGKLLLLIGAFTGIIFLEERFSTEMRRENLSTRLHDSIGYEQKSCNETAINLINAAEKGFKKCLQSTSDESEAERVKECFTKASNFEKANCTSDSKLITICKPTTLIEKFYACIVDNDCFKNKEIKYAEATLEEINCYKEINKKLKDGLLGMI